MLKNIQLLVDNNTSASRCHSVGQIYIRYKAWTDFIQFENFHGRNGIIAVIHKSDNLNRWSHLVGYFIAISLFLEEISLCQIQVEQLMPMLLLDKPRSTTCSSTQI